MKETFLVYLVLSINGIEYKKIQKNFSECIQNIQKSNLKSSNEKILELSWEIVKK